MIGSIIGDISGFMYSKLLIIMLLAVGLYFTVKCGFLQIRMFGESVTASTTTTMRLTCRLPMPYQATTTV